MYGIVFFMELSFIPKKAANEDFREKLIYLVDGKDLSVSVFD